MMSSQINFAISDLARLIGDDGEVNALAWEYAVGICIEKKYSCAAKGGGGVLTQPTACKGEDKKSKGGTGPKRLKA